jgi:hypothetical protein
MKNKIILLSLLTLLFSNHSNGQILVAGSLDFLKGEGKKMIKIDFFYKDLMVRDMSEEDYINKIVVAKNEKEPGLGDKWKINWFNNRVDYCEPEFESSFNFRFPTTLIEAKKDALDAKYSLTLKTTNICPGFFGGVISDDSSIDAYVIFKEIAKPDSVLAVISIKNAPKRYGSQNMNIRIKENYGIVGDMLARFIIKKCKLKDLL